MIAQISIGIHTNFAVRAASQYAIVADPALITGGAATSVVAALTTKWTTATGVIAVSISGWAIAAREVVLGLDRFNGWLQACSKEARHKS